MAEQESERAHLDWSAVTGSVALAPALAYGISAALGVYVLVVLLLTVQVATLAGGAGGVGTRSFLLGTLGDCYRAHAGVGTGITPGVAGVGPAGPLVYALVPPAVLVLWGVQSVRSDTDDGGATPPASYRATLRGASIALGYGLASFLGLVALGVTVGFSVAGLGPVRALVAGVVYPLVWGGLGGYAAHRL